MKLIKTVFAPNSIKWKIGKISLSRVLIDERARLSVYFLGIRIFREPLDYILKTPNATCMLTRMSAHSSSAMHLQATTPEQAFDLYPEYFKTLLRLQAWNVVAKQLNNSYKEI